MRQRTGRPIHAVANCYECDWHEHLADKALAAGLKHHKQTGHYVQAECARMYEYGEMPENSPDWVTRFNR